MRRAIKRVLARQLTRGDARPERHEDGDGDGAWAAAAAALDRSLDPDNDSVTMGTLRKAAAAVGLEFDWSSSDAPAENVARPNLAPQPASPLMWRLRTAR